MPVFLELSWAKLSGVPAWLQQPPLVQQVPMGLCLSVPSLENPKEVETTGLGGSKRGR